MKKLLSIIFAIAFITGAVACVKMVVDRDEDSWGGGVPTDSSSVIEPCEEHTYPEEWNVLKAATCEESGEKTKKCTVCGTVISEEIPALGHIEVIDNAVSATCTTAGKTAGKHCSRCNVVLTQQSTIPALGHIEVIDNAVSATCTTAGKTAGKHCSRCNVVLTAQSTIPALGHIEVIDPRVEPTAESTGKTEGKHCSRCNIVLVAQEIIPKLETGKKTLTGRYLLKSLVSDFELLSGEDYYTETVSFNYNGMSPSTNGFDLTFSYNDIPEKTIELLGFSEKVQYDLRLRAGSVLLYSANRPTHEDYRIIEFAANTEVSSRFYEWFVANAEVINQLIDISFTANNSLTSYAYSVDGEDYVTCSESLKYVNVKDGVLYLKRTQESFCMNIQGFVSYVDDESLIFEIVIPSGKAYSLSISRGAPI